MRQPGIRIFQTAHPRIIAKQCRQPAGFRRARFNRRGGIRNALRRLPEKRILRHTTADQRIPRRRQKILHQSCRILHLPFHLCHHRPTRKRHRRREVFQPIQLLAVLHHRSPAGHIALIRFIHVRHDLSPCQQVHHKSGQQRPVANRIATARRQFGWKRRQQIDGLRRRKQQCRHLHDAQLTHHDRRDIDTGFSASL